jgi:hypothetical protein
MAKSAIDKHRTASVLSAVIYPRAFVKTWANGATATLAGDRAAFPTRRLADALKIQQLSMLDIISIPRRKK